MKTAIYAECHADDVATGWASQEPGRFGVTLKISGRSGSTMVDLPATHQMLHEMRRMTTLLEFELGRKAGCCSTK